jgi:hypothetical protein
MRTKLIGVLGAAVMIAGFVGSPAAHAAQNVTVVVGAGTLNIETNDNSHALGGTGDSLIGNFTGITLNGNAQLTTAKIPTFTVISADGTDAGWTLTLTIPAFAGTGSGTGNDAIAATNVGMDAPVAFSADGTDVTGWVAGSPIGTGFGAGVAIVTTAKDQTAAGTFTVSPQTLRLLVPDTTMHDTYTSAATLTLATQ